MKNIIGTTLKIIGGITVACIGLKVALDIAEVVEKRVINGREQREERADKRYIDMR